jgi:WD40 repeat protein
MYRRPSKKQLLLQRVIVSAISVLAVLVIATGTILFILGYRLDSDKGRLEQGALLQFDSVPAAADIAIDSEPTGLRTAAKRSVIAGVHSFVVSKNGYESWAKSLTLRAGTLTWLDYIRLVPKDLKPETVASYATVVGEKASPDLKTLIIQEKSDIPTFQLVDLTAEEIKTTIISLPAALYSEAATEGVKHRFTLDHWDNGGRFVLVNHTYSNKTEWIVMDTQSVRSSVNLTRLLSISVSGLQFAGTSGNLLYGLLNDGTVRKLDLSAATISRPLMSNVKTFDLFETNVLTFVGIDPENSKRQVAGVYREGDDAAHILRRVDSLDIPLRIDATRYYSDNYIAISEGLKVTVLQGDYPTSSDEDVSSMQVHDEFSAPANVELLTFSEDGDYLVAQSGLNFIGYEVEHQRSTKAIITATEDSSLSPTLRWLDEAYLWLDYGGSLVIREFDGTNSHTINSVAEGFDATLSPNGRFIYSIVTSGDAYHLQRVKMILD